MDANHAALEHVRAAAERDWPRHRARIERALPGADVEALSAALRRAPLTLNFHPDRRLADGRPVAQALLEEGVYRSQFETRISGGGLTAHPGGDRDRWEAAMFGGAYQAPGVTAGERPRYGGLNLWNLYDGACPGFGSCHLRLRPAALQRATVIFGDSVSEPADVGLADALEPVLAPLLETRADAAAFARDLLAGFAPAMATDMYDYLEAQVHGVVRLRHDVEAVVVDPSFAGTPTGELLIAAAGEYGFAVEWHLGRSLPVAAIPEDVPDGGEYAWQQVCAGGHARRLGEQVGERLDAASIGAAAVAATHDAERLQELKYLWRMTVAYGAGPVHDRVHLLRDRRNDVLTLADVLRYGHDSFGDPDHVSLYGLRPADWYARGVRILGRTAVECTRDALADRIGRDVADAAGGAPCVVADPFAGSANTLVWIARHVAARRAVGFEADPGVFDATRRNLGLVNAGVAVVRTSYEAGLRSLRVADDELLVVFVAPPWGDALGEDGGLDLARTEPPVATIVDLLAGRRALVAVQLYEHVEPASLAAVTDRLQSWTRTTYDLDAPGRNHGLLLGSVRSGP